MRIRVASAILLGAATLVYLGVALPLRARAATAQVELARAREERQGLHDRRVALEREQEAGERAARVMAAGGGPDAVSALRAAVVSALEEEPVGGVQLRVSGGSGAVAARFQLSALGGFPEIVRLSGRLARPSAGLVLDRVRFSPTPSGLRLEAEGLTPKGAP